MAGFTKLFSSILDSTIWQEPNETRLLWITMLAMCDARGEVQASIPGLARRAGITIEECEAGLTTLSAPDRYSRTKDHEGRRISEIVGGWRLLNHGRYRELLSAEERREYNRKKQAEWRAKRQDSVNDMSMTVNHNKQCQHISEAEAEAVKIVRDTAAPPVDLKTAISYGNQIGADEETVTQWHNLRSRDGWEISKQNGSTVPVTKQNWMHDLATAKSWRKQSKQTNGHKKPQQFAGMHEEIPLV